MLSFPGHGTDYLNLALRDGGVSLTMGLANGKQEMHIKPSKVRFDDHQWHKVTVHRRIQEISSITSFCRVSRFVVVVEVVVITIVTTNFSTSSALLFIGFYHFIRLFLRSL